VGKAQRAHHLSTSATKAVGTLRCAHPADTENLMLTGSCLCGGVAYEVDAAPSMIVHCHCQTCRKTHGSAFSTVTNVPRDRFRWTKGEDLLRGFESSPGKTRYFCSQCGSHIVASREGKTTLLLRMGCLDTEIAERPEVHIWRSDAANWYDPKAELPEWPEGTAPKA
jgi:ADP-ribosyl-[dinitrogen reductase] hydrolase